MHRLGRMSDPYPLTHRHVTVAAAVLLLAVAGVALAEDSTDQIREMVAQHIAGAVWLLAEQGDPGSQQLLGNAYWAFGQYVEAMKWYRLGAAQGDLVAQTAIGVAYLLGAGVSQDHVTAYAWLSVATAQLDTEADDELPDARELRNRLAELLTADQIAEGERLACDLTGRLPGCTSGAAAPIPDTATASRAWKCPEVVGYLKDGKYPERMAREGASVAVTVHMTVNARGLVTAAWIDEDDESVIASIDIAALAVARDCRFDAKLGASDTTYRVPITFDPRRR